MKRVGVHVRRASGLPEDIDPCVKVKVDKEQESTKTIEEGSFVEWDHFFTFPVKNPKHPEAVVKFKVVDKKRLRPAKTIGKVEVPFATIENYDEKDEVQLILQDKKTKREVGKLYVSFHYKQPEVEKPLKVLCATWNVGNAAPPKELDSWLKDCKLGVYDLIAVGAQECQFSLNKDRTGSITITGTGSGALPTQSGSFTHHTIDLEDSHEHASLLSSSATSPAVTPISMTPHLTPVPTPTANAIGGLLDPWPDLESTDMSIGASTRGGANSSGQTSNSGGQSSNGGAINSGGAFQSTPWREVAEQLPTGRQSAGQSPHILDAPVTGVLGGSFTASHILDAPVVGAHILDAPAPGGRILEASASTVHILDAPAPSEHILDAPVLGGQLLQPPTLPRSPLVLGNPFAGGHILDTSVTGAQILPATVSGTHILDAPVPADAVGNVEEFGNPSPFTSIHASYLDDLQTSSSPVGPASPQSARWNMELVASMTSLQISSLESATEDWKTQEADVLEPMSATSAMLDAGSPHQTYSMDVALTTSWEGTAPLMEPAPTHPPLPPPSRGLSMNKEDATQPGILDRGPKYKKTAGALLKKIGQRVYYGTGAVSFEEVVTEAVGEQYELVDRKNMGQVRLLVFAKRKLMCAIHWTDTKSEGTGVANRGTNKGGVAVALRVGNTNICFISCHLAAHQSKVADRTHDYKEIVDGLDMDQYQMDAITGYHHVVVMGDLNYRIDFGQQKETKAESPTPEDFNKMVEYIEARRFDELLKADQLLDEMKHEHVFVGFREKKIDFAPTFKVLRNQPKEYDRKRSPAWCDRVLVRSNLPHLAANIEEYYAVPDITTSDHKPVAAIMTLPQVVHTLGASKPEHPVNPNLPRLSLHLLTFNTTCKMDTSVKAGNQYFVLRVFSPALDPEHSHAEMYEGKLYMDGAKGNGPALKEGIAMKLKPGPVREMEDDCLMFRIMGNVQGTLGRAVLSLRDVAQANLHSVGQACNFKVRLLDEGLVVGDIDGKLQIRPYQAPSPLLQQESNRDLYRSGLYTPPILGAARAGIDPTASITPTHSSTLQVYTAVESKLSASARIDKITDKLTGSLSGIDKITGRTSSGALSLFGREAASESPRHGEREGLIAGGKKSLLHTKSVPSAYMD